MKDIELVVFDMAGTTVRDRGNVADAFLAACKEHGIELERAEVKKVMGFRKKDAIRMLLSNVPLAAGVAQPLPSGSGASATRANP